MNNFFLQKIGLLLFLTALVACSDQPNETRSNQVDIKLNPVLATVNGEQLTQDDVDFMIARTFSNASQLSFDDTLRKKVLQSLVASNAMRQTMESSLPKDKLAEIKNNSRAYEEELYVKEYLIKHATPVPVSTLMVKNYYQSHLQEFGGIEQRTFEMLRALRKPSEQQRDSLLAQMAIIRKSQDWAIIAKDLDLTYQQSSMQRGLLDRSLEDELVRLGEGQTSDMILLKGIPHILRVLEIKRMATKPLSSVSADIRKKLAALQLRKSVKKASEEAIRQAEVVFN